MYICYDRHFPEGARALALNGAEIVFNPSATVAGLSDHLWHLEQPAHAVANGYYVGAINRVGLEEPLADSPQRPANYQGIEFWGRSCVCDPTGTVLTEGSGDAEEVLVAECDLSLVDETRRHWPFLRDRRIDAYADLGRRFRD